MVSYIHIPVLKLWAYPRLREVQSDPCWRSSPRICVVFLPAQAARGGGGGGGDI